MKTVRGAFLDLVLVVLFGLTLGLMTLGCQKDKAKDTTKRTPCACDVGCKCSLEKCKCGKNSKCTDKCGCSHGTE